MTATSAGPEPDAARRSPAPARRRPVRVHELVAASGLSTREVRHRLDMLGWPTTSHASTVPAEAAELLLQVVTPLPQPSAPAGAPHPYLRLLRYVARHARGWTAIVLATLVGSLVTLAAPWPLKVLADDVLGARRPPEVLSFLDDRLTLAIVALATVSLAIFVVGIVLELLTSRLWVQVGQRMVLDIAADVLAQLQRQSLSFHGRSPVGDSMARVMGDSYGLGGLLSSLLFSPFQALVLSGFAVTLLLALDPVLTLAAVGLAVGTTLASFTYGKAIARASRANVEAGSSLQSHVHQVLSGLPVVQAFRQEDRELRAFRGLARTAVRSERRAALLGGVNGLGSGFFNALGTALLLWFAAGRVLDGALTVGSLLVFLAYLAILNGQVGVFAGLYPALQGGRAPVDRVLEVLESAPQVHDRSGARPLPVVRGRLVLQDVVFGYDRERPVLRGVSLEALPGQTIALVGPSGAGKTTLASLLPRFYDPNEGAVLLDGHDLRDLRLQDLRAAVSLVLQEPFLFPISVADNIAYGRPDATREEVEQAARDANAHEFVSRLPDGYDTVVGERGASLSGGQRQRLSIARALLKDAPLLVLDEPTSALDTASERLLLSALDRLVAGRTTLIIAHRLSTVRHADQIIVLDAGRVVERGTDADLRAAGGSYAAMVAQAEGAARRRPSRAVLAR